MCCVLPGVREGQLRDGRCDLAWRLPSWSFLIAWWHNSVSADGELGRLWNLEWPVCLSQARGDEAGKCYLYSKECKGGNQCPAARPSISSWNSGGCSLNHLQQPGCWLLLFMKSGFVLVLKDPRATALTWIFFSESLKCSPFSFSLLTFSSHSPLSTCI